jgi:hypothetical protein
VESEQELGPDGKPLPPSASDKTPPTAAAAGGGGGLAPSLASKGTSSGAPGAGAVKELVPASPPKAAVRSYSFTTGYATKDSSSSSVNSSSQSRVESADKNDSNRDTVATDLPPGRKS